MPAQWTDGQEGNLHTEQERRRLSGRRVRAKMVLLGKRGDDLAKCLGKSRAYISQRLCGDADFSKADMLALAEELGVESAGEFMELFFPEMGWGHAGSGCKEVI